MPVDAAVHKDLHPAAYGVHDGGQHLGGAGTLIQHPPAVIGDNDAGSTGFQRFFSAPYRHDAFEKEGLACHGGDLLQLLHGFAACGGIQSLQEGQTGGVDIHGDGAGIGGLYQIHFMADRFQIPGLHGGNAAAAVGFQRCCGGFHDGGIGAVAGEG